MSQTNTNAVTIQGQIRLATSQSDAVTPRCRVNLGPSQSNAVTGRLPLAPAASQLLLSLFPGIDLLGRGFEEEGFSVVRGPDLLFGGDVRGFHVPAGRFDGVIGGPPCPDFSKARRGEPTGYGLAMLAEFVRVVNEARPAWWLLENVPGVPDVVIAGYSHQRIDINARELGLVQNRQRHFQFGHRDGCLITVPRGPKSRQSHPCCTASEGKRPGKRSWPDFCRLQGLPGAIELPSLTLAARYRAVGNGVPLPMARALAKAVLSAAAPDQVRVCSCSCGRTVAGRALFATPACRKRMQRRRQSLTDQAAKTAGESQP
ncbi:DNA cytosine methyltransferase [Methylomonas sp. BW4-1]|uniref:DNA (cytosine-5-)-methyltransferase n=1 Tax=Methylomonas defluvii TaxID=3045149 RepID=A0ABU4UEH0_9GAMM|nr:DNA cytosine methyltransferase [Methylomonas sp. OY6]MDX8127749.1 DNA cytosine methyltransferase [Methylomonas sp. OY6]